MSEIKVQMPIDEYCQWLEDLTASGDTINAKGLQNWIEKYAENYHLRRMEANGADTSNSGLHLQRVSFNEAEYCSKCGKRKRMKGDGTLELLCECSEEEVCQDGLTKQNRFCCYCEKWHECGLPSY